MDEDGSISLLRMSFPQLDYTNYHIWAKRMKKLLSIEGLWDLTIGEESILEEPDPDTTNGDYKKKLDRYGAQQRRVGKAVATLRMAMTDGIAADYYDSAWSSPAKIWEDVRSKYKAVMPFNLHHLWKDLYECRLEDAGTISEYLRRIGELEYKLAMCDQMPTYGQLIFHIFNGLPGTAEWNTWTIVTKASLPSLTSLADYSRLKVLLTCERGTELQRNTWRNLAVKRNNGRQKGGADFPRFQGNCYYCGKKGHKIRECRQKNGCYASKGYDLF